LAAEGVAGPPESNTDQGASMHAWLRSLIGQLRTRDDEKGQGMVEYALILVLIAIVVIVIIQVVGTQVNNVFSNISNGLSQ
jgi:pilus assembly protein Flp/PilA